LVVMVVGWVGGVVGVVVVMWWCWLWLWWWWPLL